MNVLISADMEGVAGVVIPAHTSASHPEYQRFRRLMTGEVNAAIEGALAGGADRVVVNDSHAMQTNLLIEELNPAAELICGVPKPFGMLQGIGPSVDAVFLVGYHGRAGTQGGILDHSWIGHVSAIYLNDQLVGETGLNAALAGAFAAPVVLVTGDRAVTDEARGLLGDIETVAVKDGLTRTAAQCRHPQVAQAQIRKAAERAVRLRVPPYTLASPITVRVTFNSATHADLAAMLPGSRRINGCTIEWIGEDMPAVYQAFQAMALLTMLVKLLD
jgi:D-amino peptidase